MRFTLVHSIRGRARWRCPHGFSLAAATAVADRLASLPGVLGVAVNARSGSVLVNHDGVGDVLARVAAALASVRPEECPRALVREARAASARIDFGPVLRYLFLRPLLPLPLRILATVRRALPIVAHGVRTLAGGRLNVDVLDAAAVGISLARRDYRTAGLVTLLLGVGAMLEEYTKKRSMTSLRDELAFQADKVWIRRDGAELQVPLREVTPEDTVVVRTGSSIPVDGVVSGGEGMVNQVSMTGEPMPVRRVAGGAVFAGTVLEEGTLLVRPTRIGSQTRLNSILRYIEESEAAKASIQSRAERLADRIVPLSFSLAAAVYALTRDAVRASSVLMVDYSCALRLATPLAILSAMREGARRGALVKGGRFLEAIAEVDTVVFDKTGTLTRSCPKVSDVIPADPGRSRLDVLRLTACLEEHFPHPIARAVLAAAKACGAIHDDEEHAEVQYVVAHGICSSLGGRRVVLGSAHFVAEDEGVDLSPLASEIEGLARQGKSILYLAVDGRLAGILGIEDPLREESASVVAALRARGIERVIMLTGDGPATAATVASRLGLTEYRAQLLPEDKAGIVAALKREGRRVLMVGDGVNDSPALSQADVGVTLRDGADIAQEVADVVLTANRLDELVTAIDLGRATIARIRGNFRASVGLNTLFLAGGLAGVLPPAASAALHNTTTIGVCLNGMRPKLREEDCHA